MAVRRLVVGRPKSGTIGILNRYQPPNRSGGDMPEPSLASVDILGRFDLLCDRARDLPPHPGQEMIAFAQRTEAAYCFPREHWREHWSEHGAV